MELHLETLIKLSQCCVVLRGLASRRLLHSVIRPGIPRPLLRCGGRTVRELRSRLREFGLSLRKLGRRPKNLVLERSNPCGELGRILGQRWNQLDDAGKAPYLEKARRPVESTTSTNNDAVDDQINGGIS